VSVTTCSQEVEGAAAKKLGVSFSCRTVVFLLAFAFPNKELAI
jgi:hypothetical protein